MNHKKKIIITIVLFFFIPACFLPADNKLKDITFPFYIYKNADYKYNNFFPGGVAGEINDILINTQYKTNSNTDNTCIKIQYKAENFYNEGWVGVYWQNRAYNWGFFPDGYNLQAADKLYFSAKGEKGGEFAEFSFGGTGGEYPDSTPGKSTGIIQLTRDWKIYELTLHGLNLTNINNGFSVFLSSKLNPEGCIIYLDDLYFSRGDYPLGLTTLLTKYTKLTNKIILGLKNFTADPDLSTHQDLSWIIPNIISILLMKNPAFTIIDNNILADAYEKIPVNTDLEKVSEKNKIIDEICRINFMITGTYNLIDDRINVRISVISIKDQKTLMEINSEADDEKELFIKLNTVCETIVEKISALQSETN